LRSPITEPSVSSGDVSSTFITGWSKTGPAALKASRRAARAAISKAAAEE
jgi:hypothetical protein